MNPQFNKYSSVIRAAFAVCMIGMSSYAYGQCPAVFTLSGGTCAGSKVTLSGSQTGVWYSIRFNGNIWASSLGTGSPLAWTANSIGTYTVTAENLSHDCTVTMDGSVVVITPAPVSYVLSGAGCFAEPGFPVSLSGSTAGISYQLKLNGTNVGAPKTGTGTSLQWTNLSAYGTYSVVATSPVTGCSIESSWQEIAPPMTLYTVGGGGTYSPGSQLQLTLSGSETGVTYSLYRNGFILQSYSINGVYQQGNRKGTGGPLSWDINLGGTYTIVASRGCTRTMNGSATIVNPIASVKILGTTPAVIDQQHGYYVVFFDEAGNQVDKNISSITWAISESTGYEANSFTDEDFNVQWTQAGTYHLHCDIQTTGNQHFQSDLTVVAASHEPASVVISGPSEVNIGEPAVYTATFLDANGEPAGTPGYEYLNSYEFVSDVCANINEETAFVTFTFMFCGTGTYTLQYKLSFYTSDYSNFNELLSNVLTVTVKLPAPATTFALTQNCESTIVTRNAGPPSGASYEWYWQTSPEGTDTSLGSGPSVTRTTEGPLYLRSRLKTSPFTWSDESLSAGNIAAPLKEYTVSGTNSYCQGESGVSVSLSNSQTGISYRLHWNGMAIGLSKQGVNGSQLTWTSLLNAGTYTIVAMNPAAGCIRTMPGNVSVSIKPTPAVLSVSGGGILPSGSSGTSIQLNGSEMDASYQLKLNGSDQGAAVTGTGARLEWTNLTSEGTYTITAIKTGNGCANLMQGSPQVFRAISNSASILDNYAYKYKYDGRKRLTHKKVPGAAEVYMVYDDLDRLVMTQDGEQRKLNKWSFRKYDVLNRPVITGIYTHPANIDQAGMSTLISTTDFYEAYDGTESHGYTSTVFPTENTEVLTITYYDHYNFKSLLGSDEFDYKTNLLDCETRPNGTYCQPGSASDQVTNFVTGTRIKVMDQDMYLSTVNYYDDKYRLIQTTSSNYRNGIERITQIVDFTGKTLVSKSTNADGTGSHTIMKTFEYDHAGRLLKTWHGLDNPSPVLLVKNEYNELGQMVDKKLHSTNNGSTFKQSIDFRYNIRGWLSSINNSALSVDSRNDDNNDLFGFQLAYNDDLGTGNSALFNGNISAVKWSANLGLSTTKEHAYNFDYDRMNRLLAATYRQKTALPDWIASPSFHENNLSYDLNGNILSLSRKGPDGSNVDILTYDYGLGTARSNRLLKVSDYGDNAKGFADGADTGNDYAYNDNGNMEKDNNKNIRHIAYNHLNLPETVTKTSGDYIRYIYDATGRKLSQQVFNPANAPQKRTDYAGDYFYEDGALKFINHEEGRIVMTGAAPEYQYHLKDHLGNVRLTFTAKDETENAVATFEEANLESEQSKFLRYQTARRIQSTFFDKTNGSSPGYAQRLNGSANERYGLAKSASVMPGDVLKLEAYAKYVDANSSNWTTALTNLMAAIAQNTGGVVADGTGYASSTSSFAYFGLLNTSASTGNGPKAYLNWIVFDRDYNFRNGGFVRMTDLAKETGQDVAHEKLAAEITVTEPGYVYIYLSNENETPVEVFFDDFRVEHIKSPVVQMDDYYPFGLTFNSYQREKSVENRYKYNGKEIQQELDLSTYDYGQRMHDPAVARWWQIDPLAEKYRRWSPYNYAIDNPVRFIDPDGMEVKSVTGGTSYTGADAQNMFRYLQVMSMFSPKTEPERKKAVATAKEEAKKNTPYSKLDCAALVEKSSVSAGISLNHGDGPNGVTNIARNSRKITNQDIRVGDIVTMRSTRQTHYGKDGEFDHVGIITVVGRIGGKVAGFNMVHASGSGAKEVYVDLEKGIAGYWVKNYYQWDSQIYEGESLPEVVIDGDRIKSEEKSLPSLLTSN